MKVTVVALPSGLTLALSVAPVLVIAVAASVVATGAVPAVVVVKLRIDRKGVAQGKGADLGGRRIIKEKVPGTGAFTATAGVPRPMARAGVVAGPVVRVR